MDNAIVGIFDSIQSLESAIEELRNSGCRSEDMTLVIKEEASIEGEIDIPVIQVTDGELLWDVIQEYVLHEEADPAMMAQMKSTVLNEGKYVLLKEKSRGHAMLPA
ncbi:general stress protein [Bacillus sp. FJAT-27245]|uniref:general stress protein n=1 Tax=Bacillus sp. FJAT-27245 TaxID=1684144 RepID=UPI0006A76CCE|nr:general stress protein [Bacillus sp. FJAT-27245]